MGSTEGLCFCFNRTRDAITRRALLVAVELPLTVAYGGTAFSFAGARETAKGLGTRQSSFQFSETENFNPKFLQQSAPTSRICCRHYARTVTILSENSLTSSSSLCSTTLH